jgi:hypothetical protein
MSFGSPSWALSVSGPSSPNEVVEVVRFQIRDGVCAAASLEQISAEAEPRTSVVVQTAGEHVTAGPPADVVVLGVALKRVDALSVIAGE